AGAGSHERLRLSLEAKSLAMGLPELHCELVTFARLRCGGCRRRPAGARERSRRGRRRRELRIEADPELIRREAERDHHEPDDRAQAEELRVTERATLG